MVSSRDTRSADLRGLHLIFRSGKVAFYWTFAAELSLTRVERHYSRAGVIKLYRRLACTL
jgi:hypothetical protein